MENQINVWFCFVFKRYKEIRWTQKRRKSTKKYNKAKPEYKPIHIERFHIYTLIQSFINLTSLKPDAEYL